MAVVDPDSIAQGLYNRDPSPARSDLLAEEVRNRDQSPGASKVLPALGSENRGPLLGAGSGPANPPCPSERRPPTLATSSQQTLPFDACA